MYKPTKEEIKIYPAGKTWHGEKFRKIADLGYTLNSQWIFLPGQLKDREDFHPPASQMDTSEKEALWENCLYDCSTCDALVLYCEHDDGDSLSGALVELGIATGNRKPVYCIGSCLSVEPVNNSDRAFTHQKLWHWVPETDIEKGYEWVIKHYQENYVEDWNKVNIHYKKLDINEPVEKINPTKDFYKK